MRFYFAPMEGITGYIYRNIHHKYFPGTDRYFTPFLSPGPEKGLGRKEVRDVLPDNNRDVPVTPQILTNRSEDFLKAADMLAEMGYREVNLNLGCPSGTVVAKKKGAGLLAYPEELDALLDRIFNGMEEGRAHMAVSVKTRIGVNSPDEFPRILEIYNRYPIKELTIHPRVRADYYRNSPNLDAFAAALPGSRNPVVYNGDIFTADDFKAFSSRFPQVDAVMIGRGNLINPMLVETIREGRLEPPAASLERVRAFHDELCAAYGEAFSGDKNVLFKMKELWNYMIHLFPDSAGMEKRIKKAQSMRAYLDAADELFHTRMPRES